MISIIYSTKKVDDNYIKHLKETCGLEDVEILYYTNNGEKSLSCVYNELTKKTKYNIIVSIHDDLIFETKNWGVMLYDLFTNNKDYSIIGLAGGFGFPLNCFWPHSKETYGIVNHFLKNNIKSPSYFSKKLPKMELANVNVLDGLFIAYDKNKIKNYFNEDFNGFHFYDTVFSLENYFNGCKIGVTTDILVTHKSKGNYDQEWAAYRSMFMDKFNNYFNII